MKESKLTLDHHLEAHHLTHSSPYKTRQPKMNRATCDSIYGKNREERFHRVED